MQVVRRVLRQWLFAAAPDAAVIVPNLLDNRFAAADVRGLFHRHGHGECTHGCAGQPVRTVGDAGDFLSVWIKQGEGDFHGDDLLSGEIEQGQLAGREAGIGRINAPDLDGAIQINLQGQMPPLQRAFLLLDFSCRRGFRLCGGEEGGFSVATSMLWGIVASISRSQINTRKKYAEVTNSIARKGQGRGLRPVSFSLAESRGRASGASPHSIYTMISERTEAVNSRRRTTRTPSSRTRPKRMTVPSTVYSTTPY